MELRKCVNHPYLFDGVEPQPFTLGEHLVEASGKLRVLDRLLHVLRRDGHRVLLFSQMTRMLDVLQDYLGFRGYAYERLDGSVRGEERFAAVAAFHRDEQAFVFLLSTRAGGQGLNLVGADTVIIYDADWNPQNDLQAIARAHRLGQRRPVKVIRLTARHTVEEVIDRRSQRKLRLTRAVVNHARLAGGGETGEASEGDGECDGECDGGSDGRTATGQGVAAASVDELAAMLKFGLRDLASTDSDVPDTAAPVPARALPPLPSDADIVAMVGESRNGKWVVKEDAVVQDAAGLRSESTSKGATDHPSRLGEGGSVVRATATAGAASGGSTGATPVGSVSATGVSTLASFAVVAEDPNASESDEESRGDGPVGGELARILGSTADRAADAAAFGGLVAARLADTGDLESASDTDDSASSANGGRRRRRRLRRRTSTAEFDQPDAATTRRTKPDALLSPEEAERRRVMRAARAAKAAETRAAKVAERKRRRVEREAENRRAVAKRWAAANYTSSNLPDPANSDSDSDPDTDTVTDTGMDAHGAGAASGLLSLPSHSSATTADDEGDEGSALHYTVGNVTQPKQPRHGPAIIAHVVDDSGAWGRGGVFSALSALGPATETAYAEAARMHDVHLGDCHRVRLDVTRADGSPLDACLLVAQHRSRTGHVTGIKYDALEVALRRLAAYARTTGASVHLPRIGYATPGFNWYGTERLLRKHLAGSGVQTYVYYFRARGTAGMRRASTTSSSDGGDADGRGDEDESGDEDKNAGGVRHGQSAAAGESSGEAEPHTDAAAPAAPIATTGKATRAAAGNNGRPGRTSALADAGAVLPSALSDVVLGLADDLAPADVRQLLRLVIAFDGSVADGVDGTCTDIVAEDALTRDALSAAYPRAGECRGDTGRRYGSRQFTLLFLRFLIGYSVAWTFCCVD